MTAQAFNLDVSTKVSLFDPKETMFIDISRVSNRSLNASTKELILRGTFLKSKNLLILGSKTFVTDALTIDVTTTENMNDNTLLKILDIPNGLTEERYVTDSIAKIINYLKTTSSTDLTIYYPTIPGTTIDSRIIMHNPITELSPATITSSSDVSLNNLLTPGGDNLLIVVPKNSSYVNINLNRSSYLNRICPRCPTYQICAECQACVCPPPICPISSLESESRSESDCVSKSDAYIIVISILAVIVVILVCALDCQLYNV